MPQLIRTPEEIFRAEAKDIYFIAIKDDKGQESPAWGEIQEWLKSNLPDTRVEMMAPSVLTASIFRRNLASPNF